MYFTSLMIDNGSIYNSLSYEQLRRFERLSELLRRENRKYNLTRIIEPEDIRLRHFCDSLAAVEILKKLDVQNAKMIDIGSGAGFPGLAIAIALSGMEINSVDATAKKIAFQQLAADELGLINFTAVQGRAEEIGHDPDYRERFDIATSRAVADLAVLLELTLPLLKVGGYLLAWKGSKADEEIENAQNAIDTLGGKIVEQLTYTLEKTEGQSAFRIIVIKKIKLTPPEYPRRMNAIKKKTL